MDRLSIEKKAVCYFIGAYIASKIWTVLPEGDSVFAFFPFSDITMSTRMYFWFLCKSVEILMIYSGVTLMTVKFKAEVMLIWLLYLLDIPDFMLVYSEPIFYIRTWPIEYGLIKGLILILLFIKIKLRW